MPRQASILFAGAFLLLVLATAFCATPADAKDCKILNKHLVWKHAGGTFRKLRGTNTWVEYNKEGNEGSRFSEKMVEGDQVVIHDPARELSILLRGDLAGIQNKGEQNYQQLYAGGWTRTVDCT